MANLNIGFSAVATGTADVITATFTPAITLSDRRIVFLRVTTPNATTTPTFNPNSLGAQVVKGKNGATLKIGELTGDCILMYHTTGTYWEVLNSTPFLDATSSIQTQLDSKHPTANFFAFASNTYTDSTSYYLGQALNPVTATSQTGGIALKAGVITACIISVFNGGTVASNENCTLNLVHGTNYGTTSLIANDIQLNANRQTIRLVTGLNISVTDCASLVNINIPVLATNPNGLQIRITFFYA